jgi:hypothetical protein
MNPSAICRASLCLALLTGALAAAPDAVAATTPEGLLKDLEAAAKAGDVQKYFENFGAGYRKQLIALVAIQDGLAQDCKAFADALTERLGKDEDGTPLPRPASDHPLGQSLVRMKSIELLGQEKRGDKVVLKVRFVYRGEDGKDESKEANLMVVKEGGDWRVVPPANRSPEKLNHALEVLTKQKAALEKVIGQIRDGHFQSRSEAVMALKQALAGG